MTNKSDSNRFPDPTKLVEGEFAKSQQTRTRILDAAVDCLAETGYHLTSTTAVSRRAGLSRTAMLYHFPSRMDLINATIQYVFLRRVEIQQDMQRNISQDDSFHGRSVDIAWQQTQVKEFAAFCELSTAARTDPKLATLFKPSFQAFDQARREMSSKLAEETKVVSPGFDLRCDITRFLLEGIAQQAGLTFDSAERLKQVKLFLENLWHDESDVKISELVSNTGG